MSKSPLTSLSNPLVKQARALRQKRARVESGLFLVEGIHHVGEAVEAGWDVQSLLYTSNVLTSQFAAELIIHLGDKPQPVSTEIMESLADKENPQGILAVVRQRETKISNLKPFDYAQDKSPVSSPSTTLRTSPQSPKPSVALVSPQDPGNLGTILRTMDAVGACALFLLDGGVDLYHPTVIRSSMGAIFWKPVVSASFDEFLAWARAGKVQLIGTSAHAAVDYRALVPNSPWVLALGSEQKGLSPEQIEACDVTVSLPMQGRVSSLNLAVAAGVLLYALNE